MVKSRSELYGLRVALVKSADDDENTGSTPSHQEVLDFLKNNQYPDDAKWHGWCDKNGYNVHKAEAVMYFLATKFANLATGGKSRGEKDEVDPDQLQMGIQVELEHTKDKDVSEKIARDHLAEFPTYYTALKEMENKLEKAKESK